MRRKGFYFSFDAFLALSIMAASLLIVAQSSDIANDPYEADTITYRKASLVGQDAMKLASQQTFTRFNSTFKQELMDETVLNQEDMNRTILDGIAKLWAARNFSHARTAAERYFDLKIPGEYGYNLTVTESGTTYALYNTTNTSGRPGSVSSIARLVSGHRIDRPDQGFQARAVLSSVTKQEKEVVFFGGYVGDGDITYNVSLPDLHTVLNVTVEGDFSGPFELSFNGVNAGSYSPSGGNLSADVFQVCTNSVNPARCQALDSGSNRIHIHFTGQNKSIGGGFLKIEYNRTTNLDPQSGKFLEKRKDLPGIDGIINYYGSFYVPGRLHGIDAQLHFDAVNQTIFMRFGNATVYRNYTGGEQTVTIDNQTIFSNVTDAGLNYDTLSQRTVPLRVGLLNIGLVYGRANADSVSVIDDSGSMGGSKMDEAKDAGKTFVRILLNASGNRAGVVGYDDAVTDTHQLSEDKASLNSTIDGLTADGNTCIGCGILEAGQILTEPRMKTLLSKKSRWFYNNSFLESAPPDLGGKNWTQLDYNDTTWENGTAVIGNSSAASTTIQSNGTLYLRNYFSYDRSRYKGVSIAVRSDDAASIYLNGRLVDNDTNEHAGTYWNRITGEPYVKDVNTSLEDGFERADLGPDWQVTSGSEGDEVNIDNTCGSYDGSEAAILRWGGGTLQTNLSFYSGPYSLKLSYAMTQGDDGGGCENPEGADDIRVEYLDSGGAWNLVREHDGGSSDPAEGDWDRYSFTIPASDYHPNIEVRFRYVGGSGSDYDYWAVDNLSVRALETENVSSVNSSWLREGKNVVAAALKNDDRVAEIDLQVNATEKRKRSMIVMSDGEANVETSMTGVPDHNGNGYEDAKDHTIEAGCRVHDNYNVTVYTVGFGSGADEWTLNETAKCGDGEYFYSDTGDLEAKFRNISERILNASFVGQTVETDADDAIGQVYRDSYIRFNYSSGVSFGYGKFPLQQISGRFGGSVTSPKNGTFRVPPGFEPVSARVTSYSSNRWTDRVRINQSSGFADVYRLSSYGTDYRELGDPYIVQIPANLINQGSNKVQVDTALTPSTPEGGSPDNRVLYTVLVDSSVGYNGLFPNATAARSDAEERLMDKLDVDNDGSPDVSLDSDDIDMTSTEIGGQPYLWGPASVKLVVWRD